MFSGSKRILHYVTFILLEYKVHKRLNCTFCFIVYQVYSTMYETSKGLYKFLCKLSLVFALAGVILKFKGGEECSSILFA